MPQCHTTLCQTVFKVEKREEVLEKIYLVSPLRCCTFISFFSPVTSIVFLSVCFLISVPVNDPLCLLH